MKRLSRVYSNAFVATVAAELAAAREVVKQGLAPDGEAYVLRIHEWFTYRMENPSEFMKALLQRFTRWHNRQEKRRGRWRPTSNLNPVRAGMVAGPAEYRWSSYGEAMGATGKGGGAKAKAGLVRAVMADKGWEADARRWAGQVSKRYRMILLEEGEETLRETINTQGERVSEVVKKGMPQEKKVGDSGGASYLKLVGSLNWILRKTLGGSIFRVRGLDYEFAVFSFGEGSVPSGLIKTDALKGCFL